MLQVILWMEMEPTLVEKPLSHTLHLKGLSLVCDRMWISSAELQANVFRQIWHVVFPRAAARKGDSTLRAGSRVCSSNGTILWRLNMKCREFSELVLD